MERGHFVVTVGGTHEVARMGPHGDWLKWEHPVHRSVESA